MNTLEEVIDMLSSMDRELEKFHVKKLGFFGSFARGEQSDSSDIDILVEFTVGQETLDNYMGLKFFIEDMLQRKVDLVISSAIKESLKRPIMESVKYIVGA